MKNVEVDLEQHIEGLTLFKKSKLLFGLIILLSTIFFFIGFFNMYFIVSPFKGFNVSGHPVFYMISQAFTAFIMFGIGSLTSILYLIKRNLKYDLIMISAIKTGALASALTLLIGILWSRVEWGYYWQFEPRQTMTLIMFLFYVSIIVFRTTLDDIYARAKLTAVLGLIALPTIPLTNFIVGSLHPAPQQTAMSSNTFLGVIIIFVGTILVYSLLFYFTLLTEKINLRLEQIKFNMLKTQEDE